MSEIATNPTLYQAYASATPSTIPYRLRPRRRLVWLVSTVWLISFLVVSLAVSYGRLHPSANAAANLGLSLCGSTACLGALIPGQTQWSEELANVNHHRNSFLLDPRYRHIALAPSQDEQLLETISIYLSTGIRVTASDIVSLYGTPCRVTLHTAMQGYMVLHYASLYVYLDVANGQLKPDTAITLIVLSAAAYRPDTATADPCNLNVKGQTVNIIQRAWHGFTSLQYYLTDSP
jgi:hypothetical protein